MFLVLFRLAPSRQSPWEVGIFHGLPSCVIRLSYLYCCHHLCVYFVFGMHGVCALAWWLPICDLFFALVRAVTYWNFPYTFVCWCAQAFSHLCLEYGCFHFLWLSFTLLAYWWNVMSFLIILERACWPTGILWPPLIYNFLLLHMFFFIRTLNR